MINRLFDLRLALAPLLLAATVALASPEKPVLSVEKIDGGSWSLADQQGKWVVVNYWATWCTPCIKEMPELSELHAERADVEVIGLAFEETEADDIRKFLEVKPVSYPVAQIDVFEPPADFDVPRGLPMTYLIAPDGSVAKKYLGPITREELEEAVGPAR
ncbi:MAG: TlpA family protein disulfide reductase [Xanthomonadales bacterium]|nr:TlpA family protein disulfide reductase [Xanthomonadales bacterium]